jgi:chromosome partitioning protein
LRVVAVAGAKGGVGKTAAAVNLAMRSAQTGHRTLLWDLDPQGAATHCYRARARVKGGASRLLGGKRDLETYVRRTDHEGLDLLPADPSFRIVDTILAARRWPDRVIRKLLRPLDTSYDVVVLDCAPGLGVATESVIAASDLLLAPIIPAPLSVRSLDQLTDFVEGHRPGMPVLAFLSMLDERKVLHRQVVAQVRSDRRFALAAVPVSSAVERMGMEQVPAILAAPHNLAAVAYRRLWAEVEDRLDLQPRGGRTIDLTVPSPTPPTPPSLPTPPPAPAFPGTQPSEGRAAEEQPPARLTASPFGPSAAR